MKSVPNLIYYLYNFPGIFLQYLAIYFELLPFGSVFNSKNADVWGPAVSGSVAPCHTLVGCRGQHCPDTRMWVKSRSDRPVSGDAAALPTPSSPRLVRAHPDRAVSHVRS
jgi:hypothetical protein